MATRDPSGRFASAAGSSHLRPQARPDEPSIAQTVASENVAQRTRLLKEDPLVQKLMRAALDQGFALGFADGTEKMRSDCQSVVDEWCGWIKDTHTSQQSYDDMIYVLNYGRQPERTHVTNRPLVKGQQTKLPLVRWKTSGKIEEERARAKWRAAMQDPASVDLGGISTISRSEDAPAPLQASTSVRRAASTAFCLSLRLSLCLCAQMSLRLSICQDCPYVFAPSRAPPNLTLSIYLRNKYQGDFFV